MRAACCCRTWPQVLKRSDAPTCSTTCGSGLMDAAVNTCPGATVRTAPTARAVPSGSHVRTDTQSWAHRTRTHKKGVAPRRSCSAILQCDSGLGLSGQRSSAGRTAGGPLLWGHCQRATARALVCCFVTIEEGGTVHDTRADPREGHLYYIHMCIPPALTRHREGSRRGLGADPSLIQPRW